MCGIALIISGIRIDLSSILVDATSPPPKSHQRLEFSVDDLKAALRRRGPDSLGSKKLLLHSNNPTSIDDRQIISVIEDSSSSLNGKAELLFIGATLQLRGLYPIFQPFLDSSRNILVYNGEIFDGIHVGSHGNDGEVLMHTLAQCCSCKSHNGCEEKGRSSVVDVLSSIKGPWALIYWQDSSKTLWFGRDALGRRSLLVHWPTEDDARFLLSSVSPPSSLEQNLDPEVENGISKLNFWEELPCGVYSLSMDVSELDRCFVGELRKHEWTNAMLMELIKWERILVEPTTENCGFSHCETHLGEHNIHSACSDIISESGPKPASVPCSMSVQRVLNALRKSVMQRSSLHTIFELYVVGDKRKLLQWQCSSLGD